MRGSLAVRTTKGSDMGRGAAVLLAMAVIGACAVAPSNAAHQAAGPPRSLAAWYTAPEPVAVPVVKATPAARQVTSGAPPTNPSWSADITSPRINQVITFTGFADDP